MTQEVVVLENEVTLMGKTFSVYGTVEEPLFKAKDVADWIEHSNPRAMLESVDEDEKGVRIVYTLGGNQETWFLTENGVYEVLMLSRKPIAKSFKKEVKKMLHELRLSRKPQMPTNLADALEAYAKEIRAKEEAQRLLIESNKRAEEAEDLRAHDHYLVKEKYLSATEVKAIVKDKTGENVVMTKVQKILGLEYPDVMYKPFTKGNYHGQQTVYAPEVVDKICDAIEEITE